jgi:hypothetical protein
LIHNKLLYFVIFFDMVFKIVKSTAIRL